MFVIVLPGISNMSMSVVFGPFGSLNDPELKKVLVKKGLMAEHEEPTAKSYSNSRNIYLEVCEVHPALKD